MFKEEWVSKTKSFRPKITLEPKSTPNQTPQNPNLTTPPISKQIKQTTSLIAQSNKKAPMLESVIWVATILTFSIKITFKVIE